MSLGGPCKDCYDDSCGYLDEEVCAFETDYAKVIRDLREINVLAGAPTLRGSYSV